MRRRAPGQATLYVFGGLPGVGKTALCQAYARTTGHVYLRIDTVEQGLRDLCGVAVTGQGYRLSYRIARDNLELGTSVIADSCNPIELTRREWRALAESAGARVREVEVVCSDTAEHRRRVEQRRVSVAGLVLPTWHDVLQREYHAWQGDRLVLDTAHGTVAQCVAQLVARLDRD